jgi:hypothetical protein
MFRRLERTFKRQIEYRLAAMAAEPSLALGQIDYYDRR